MSAGEIRSVPILVDSPMALAALELYRQAVEGADPDVRGDISADPFGLDRVHLAATVGQSIALNSPRQPCIIVSASGGRVVHHLAHLRKTVATPSFSWVSRHWAPGDSTWPMVPPR